MTPRPAILIVDDELKNIQVVGALLLREGYEVITARGGEEGITKAREAAPDLILLDLMMPGLSGTEVARQLREDPAWLPVPILFLSAATNKSFIVEALEAGAVDYVPKPFHGPELIRRVELHLGLSRTTRALEAVLAEKNHLIEVLAHDLKNPLGSVRFAAHLLQEQQVGGKVDQLAGMIVDSSNRAIEIVESLLETRTVENAVANLRIEPLAIDQIIHEARTEFISQAEEKGIQLEEFKGNDGPFDALADRSCLLRILENLVSNAIKFTPRNSTVRISLMRYNTLVEVLVEDEGPGILPHEINLLFKRYARLSSRPTAGESSTGLGLSIVKDLAVAMNARIAYLPALSGGAGFRLSLPVA
jgi:two-component system sensor histidine kinase/response regulator